MTDEVAVEIPAGVIGNAVRTSRNVENSAPGPCWVDRRGSRGNSSGGDVINRSSSDGRGGFHSPQIFSPGYVTDASNGHLGAL
nr:MAG TPA: hypothetical protein [Caudoviricetes sp.]